VDTLLSRMAHLVLPRVEILLPNGTSLVGKGRIYWSGGDFPLLSAITDKLPGWETWIHGRRIIGSTDNGSKVEINCIGKDWKVISSGECIDWELPCEEVTVRWDLNELPPKLQPEGCQLSGVFDPWPLGVAGRKSIVRDDNPAFGKERGALDWGQITVNGINFSFREVGDACHFRLRASDTETIWKTFEAIRAGLSFLFGCRVRLRGWGQMVGPNVESVLLGDRPRAMRRVYPPLDNGLWQLRKDSTENDLRGFEQPFTLASSFFLSPMGEKFRPLLQLAWDAADLTMESRLLTAAVVLEGLVREVETCSRTPLPFSNEVLSHIKNLTADETVLARWQGLVNGSQQLHVPTVLRQWASNGRYQATEEECKAFKTRRNPLAHGSSLKDTDDTAKRDLSFLMNLINKVVLTQMGYRGPFADYSGNRDYNQSCPIML